MKGIALKVKHWVTDGEAQCYPCFYKTRVGVCKERGCQCECRYRYVEHNFRGPDPCLACLWAKQADKYSICWGCGHTIDHAVGHKCGALDD